MKIRTPYSPLALFTCQRDEAVLRVRGLREIGYGEEQLKLSGRAPELVHQQINRWGEDRSAPTVGVVGLLRQQTL